MGRHDRLRKNLGRTPAAITLGFVLTLLFLLASAGATFRAGESIVAGGNRLAATQTIVAALEQIYSSINYAETSQRGYILSGEEALLEDYRRQRRVINRQIRDVGVLVAFDPVQVSELGNLQTAVDQKFVEMDSVLEARKRGLERAVSLITAGSGLAEMENVRGILNTMERRENANVNRYQAERRRSIGRGTTSFMVGVVCSIALVGGLYLMIRRLLYEQDRSRRVAEESAWALAAEIERKVAAEEELTRVLTELQRSNRELQDFAFVASHDLQEPLRKINAFGERLRKRLGPDIDPDSKDYLDRMQAASARMQTLIIDLLNLSRVTTKGQPFQDVPLDDVLAAVRDDLYSRLEETGGSILGSDLPVVRADPTQMHQLLLNLLSNALKFRNAGVPPVIRVEVEESKGGWVRLKVGDNGIGFDQRHADRIFTIFQRLHGRGQYEGSGIGLSVARKIVERHGGHIRAVSSLGEGATFLFDLPLAQK